MPRGIDGTAGNEESSSRMLSICYFSESAGSSSVWGCYLPAQAAGFWHRSGVGKIASWPHWGILQFPFP